MISAIDSAGGSSSNLVDQVAEIFSPSGILSKSKTFEYRPEQQQMAVAVARALVNQEHLAVEAGTGVGFDVLLYFLQHIPSIFAAIKNRRVFGLAEVKQIGWFEHGAELWSFRFSLSK